MKFRDKGSAQTLCPHNNAMTRKEKTIQCSRSPCVPPKNSTDPPLTWLCFCEPVCPVCLCSCMCTRVCAPFCELHVGEEEEVSSEQWYPGKDCSVLVDVCVGGHCGVGGSLGL